MLTLSDRPKHDGYQGSDPERVRLSERHQRGQALATREKQSLQPGALSPVCLFLCVRVFPIGRLYSFALFSASPRLCAMCLLSLFTRCTLFQSTIGGFLLLPPCDLERPRDQETETVSLGQRQDRRYHFEERRKSRKVKNWLRFSCRRQSAGSSWYSRSADRCTLLDGFIETILSLVLTRSRGVKQFPQRQRNYSTLKNN